MKKHYLLFIEAITLLVIVIVSVSADIDAPITTKWLAKSRSLESSTVLFNNEQNLIPLRDLENQKIACVSLGTSYSKEFSTILKKYSQVTPFTISNAKQPLELDTLNADLKFFNTVILEVTDATLANTPVQSFISELQTVKQLVIVAYGDPKNTSFANTITCPVIWMSQNTPEAAIYAAQAVFGGVAITPHSENLSSNLKGSAYNTSVSRLKYTVPEEVGIKTENLETPIDKIVEEAIAQKATPAAVVMIVKNGKVIFNKAYGHHTYDGIPTKTDDIFDLASVTKIAATTMAAMRLYEQNQLKLETTIDTYIPLVRNTDKSSITVKELLLHQAGLVPYIPFFEALKPIDYSRDSSSLYPLKVADNYYLRANYFSEVMWPQMLNSPLQSRGKYVYSDLSMYLLKDIIERLTTERLDKYVASQFYAPLGMYTAGFNPRNHFDKKRIVPTEQDDKFRKTLVHGYVHDQGASMAGGVSGHAGLFSSANDLAILCQMLLNGGTYGGKRYFKPETIDLFTAKNSNVSRRGLGFDRWDPDRTNRYPSDLASDKSYGHTGYTGTAVWVDPEYDLIYIFLSNRVYPTVTNKLSSMRIRPRIQDVIYEAIKKGN